MTNCRVECGEVFEYFCGVVWWHCVPLFKVFSKGFVDCFWSAFSYYSEEESFFFRTRSDPKIRPNFILLTFLLLYSVQYRIFVCRSSKYHYLDHLAQRAKNLVKKWPNSQKRKSGQRGNSFFSCYTAPPTQEFNILSRKSVIHANIFFLDTNIESSNISHLEIKKMYIPLISSTSNDTDSILPGSSANISDAKILTNIVLSGSISISKASEIIIFSYDYVFDNV